MRVYLDNCAYNRPYDDQSQVKIELETQAKLKIQRMIKINRLNWFHHICHFTSAERTLIQVVRN